MEIPTKAIKSETLTRIIEAFILQEGTDYGHREYTLEEKVTMVRSQLSQGKAAIQYDEMTESCTIIPK